MTAAEQIAQALREACERWGPAHGLDVVRYSVFHPTPSNIPGAPHDLDDA